MSESIQVEVVYALPHKQSLVQVTVPAGSSIVAAIEASGLLSEYPEIDLSTAKLGIWNRVVKSNETLKNGDRIEIYRPLIADPKEVRKRRAEKAKQEGRADQVTGGRPNPLKAKTTEQ